MTDTLDAIAVDLAKALDKDYLKRAELILIASRLAALSNQGEGAKPVAWVVTCHTDDCEDFSQLVRDEAFIERMRSHGLVKSVEPLYAHPAEADRRDAERWEWDYGHLTHGEIESPIWIAWDNGNVDYVDAGASVDFTGCIAWMPANPPEAPSR